MGGGEVDPRRGLRELARMRVVSRPMVPPSGAVSDTAVALRGETPSRALAPEPAPSAAAQSPNRGATMTSSVGRWIQNAVRLCVRR